ncbi:glycosyl hydrolase family 63 [Halanaerobium saccharolyticum]|jgi:glycogen debranching enzyme|uniref:Glycosyl hydrolase family 63 n=1 Tax=Halanaerobium saccharolyticum TaxID=43595 RepID=A0A2T5RLL1_9FIRM|nr:trehalase family glycosidase [Halanaerobium saccharolyticum]PTW00142.1 glycosyl hydrolase family 63 [Halanaerobium saccharolyticum]TDP93597.1 glycosyl hydrolase family 63 [Halanaerobium saccharolyticum]
MNIDKLKNSYDLQLPTWGPYTKKYLGISHIADQKRGIRFDLSVFPGYYRRKVKIPNVSWESDYHPWEAASDLKYYSNRHQLEWKDKLYCDISYSEIDDHSRLIRCNCVNHTDSIQNIVMHFMGYINLPKKRLLKINAAADSVWINALEYTELKYSNPSPQDNLMPDGLLRGEVHEPEFFEGTGLGRDFGKDKDDRVNYELKLEKDIDDAVLLIRYQNKSEQALSFNLEGIIDKEIEFPSAENVGIKMIQLGNLPTGEHKIKLISNNGGAEIKIDGFLVTALKDKNKVSFTAEEHNPVPEVLEKLRDNSLILKYEDIDQYYGIKWFYNDFEIREFESNNLDSFMKRMVHDHVSKKLVDDENGKPGMHYTNVFLRPITIEANSSQLIYGMVCNGSRQEVESKLSHFKSDKENMDELYNNAREDAFEFNQKLEGDKYKFSQQKMAATTLTNVVYPTYIRKGYIKHYPPGRWWDSLYTWDSGFIGLGLSELDEDRAIECLNAYLTEPGDQHSAFIHHGSPVPVQIYLFLELWNRLQSKEFLEYFYPRLKQYHQFLAGRLGSSTTRNLKSNLLKTWDYFYNSGGWDDYPAQVYVHDQNLEDRVTPVINTAQAIRTAKILKMAAWELGLKSDIEEFDQDIDTFTKALQKHSWDEESGYFSYVLHDQNGKPKNILKDNTGKNYNMGLDGVSPLVAGICNQDQEKRLIDKLFSKERMWTEIGISTVDKTAPYYKNDGYWNGSVWMPHQWFIWKTLLDLNRADLAYKIAITGLELWQNEVDKSYSCFEHFLLQSKRGAGWHHFSGLSTPVMSWFAAYFTAGKLTVGFDTWVINQEFKNDNSSLEARLRIFGNNDGVNITVSLNSSNEYNVLWNGKLIKHEAIKGGILNIQIPGGEFEGDLEVLKAE